MAFKAIPKNGASPNDYGERVDYFLEKVGDKILHAKKQTKNDKGTYKFNSSNINQFA